MGDFSEEEFIRELKKQEESPMKSKLRQEAVNSACARAVEALRYGAKYDDILKQVKDAMDLAVCETIHEE